jgi:hypothetical protein
VGNHTFCGSFAEWEAVIPAEKTAVGNDALLAFLFFTVVFFVIVVLSLTKVAVWKDFADYKDTIAAGLPLTPDQLSEWRRRHTGRKLSRIASKLDFKHFDILRQYTLYAPPEEATRALLLLETLTDKHLFGSNSAYHQQEVAYLDLFLRSSTLLRNPSLVMRLVQKAEAVGDTRTLRRIVSLTKCPVQSPEQDAAQREARRVYHAIKERLEQEKVSMRLLRPSDAPQSAVLLRPIVDATDPDRLLRPASGVSETDLSLLVRPANPGE